MFFVSCSGFGYSSVLKIACFDKLNTHNSILDWKENYTPTGQMMKIVLSFWNVIPEPVPTILGGPDLYVEEGSTINLTCSIRFGFEPVGHIFWYHENKVCKLLNTFAKLKFIKSIGHWNMALTISREKKRENERRCGRQRVFEREREWHTKMILYPGNEHK